MTLGTISIFNTTNAFQYKCDLYLENLMFGDISDPDIIMVVYSQPMWHVERICPPTVQHGSCVRIQDKNSIFYDWTLVQVLVSVGFVEGAAKYLTHYYLNYLSHEGITVINHGFPHEWMSL